MCAQVRARLRLQLAIATTLLPPPHLIPPVNSSKAATPSPSHPPQKKKSKTAAAAETDRDYHFQNKISKGLEDLSKLVTENHQDTQVDLLELRDKVRARAAGTSDPAPHAHIGIPPSVPFPLDVDGLKRFGEVARALMDVAEIQVRRSMRRCTLHARSARRRRPRRVVGI